MITLLGLTFKEYLDFSKIILEEHEEAKSHNRKETKERRKRINSRFESVRCPHCSSLNHLEIYSYYERTVVFYTSPDLTLESQRITVPRLKCSSCNTTHALLHVSFIPYSQSTIDTVCLSVYIYKYMNQSQSGSHSFAIPTPLKTVNSVFTGVCNTLILPDHTPLTVSGSPSLDLHRENEVIVTVDFSKDGLDPETGLYETFVTPSGIEVLTEIQNPERFTVPFGFGSLERPENLQMESLQIGSFSIQESENGKALLIPKNLLQDLHEMVPLGIPAFFNGSNKGLGILPPTISSLFCCSCDSYWRSPLLYDTYHGTGNCRSGILIGVPGLQEALGSFLEAKGNILAARSFFPTIFFPAGPIPDNSPDMRNWIRRWPDHIVFGPVLQKRGYSFEEQIEGSIYGVPSSSLYHQAEAFEKWLNYTESVFRELGKWDGDTRLKPEQAVLLLFSIDLCQFQEKMFELHGMPFMFPYERRRNGFPYTGYISRSKVEDMKKNNQFSFTETA